MGEHVALLSARERRVMARALAWTLLVCAGGCALLHSFGKSEEDLAFSHRIHVGDLALDCANCHEDVAVADEPGMPSPDTCSACHDELDVEKPPERQVVALFQESEFHALHASALEDEVVFSHLRHVRAGVSCTDCHAAVETSGRVQADMRVTMTSCTTWHGERKVAAECSTCHTYVNRDWAPESHHHDWVKAHGPESKGGEFVTASNCALCHEERTCATCHLEREPDDHNNYFRRRGHAVIARMDRERCAACHQPDCCDRCHRETEPLSRRTVGRTPRRAALSVTNRSWASCALCHQATPSHQLASPKPPDHNPAMNCRMCHGLFAPLPHVENGDDCNGCHH
jgi:hypothetical protein